MTTDNRPAIPPEDDPSERVAFIPLKGIAWRLPGARPGTAAEEYGRPEYVTETEDRKPDPELEPLRVHRAIIPLVRREDVLFEVGGSVPTQHTIQVLAERPHRCAECGVSWSGDEAQQWRGDGGRTRLWGMRCDVCRKETRWVEPLRAPRRPWAARLGEGSAYVGLGAVVIALLCLALFGTPR